jgi:CDGSH-type Zn-finger protein
MTSVCACRTSDSLPFCDGNHRKEKGIKKYNEFLLMKNTELKQEMKRYKCVEIYKNVLIVGGFVLAAFVMGNGYFRK